MMLGRKRKNGRGEHLGKRIPRVEVPEPKRNCPCRLRKENAPPAVWFYCGAARLRAAIRTIIRPAVAWLSGRNEPRSHPLSDRNPFLVSSHFIYSYNIYCFVCQGKSSSR